MTKRGKWVLLSVLSIILLCIVSVYLYFFAFNGLESMVVDAIQGDDEDSPYIVEIGNIGGSLVKDVVLDNVRISFKDSAGIHPLLTAKKITAVYSASDLLSKNYLFDEVYVDSLLLTLVKNENGQWQLPFPIGGTHHDSSDTSGAAPATPEPPPQFSVKQLALSQTSFRLVQATGDTTVIKNLSILASVSGEGGMYSADIKRLDFASGSMPGITRVTGKISYSNGTIVVQDFQISRNGTRIKISGTYAPDEKTGAAHLSADHIDLEEISQLTGAKLKGKIDLTGNVSFVDGRLKGQVTAGGTFLFAGIENLFIDFTFEDKVLTFDTVYGTIFENCAIDGNGRVDLNKPETYSLDADLSNFDLSQMLPKTFASNLTGHLRLDGSSFSNEDLLLHVDVNLFESSFDEYPLQAAKGRLDITTVDLSFPEPFHVVYYENEFAATGNIVYDGDIDLDVDADLPNLDRYQGRFFINQPGGRAVAKARFSGKTSDPDLSGWVSSDSLWVYGLYADTCFAEFDIARFLTGREGTVTVDMLAGEAWQVPYDTGRAEIRLDSLQVWIEDVHMGSSKVTMFGGGLFDQSYEPELLRIDTLALTVFGQEFYNRGALQVAIDTAGFDLLSTTIGKDRTSVMARGRLNYDETMNLRVEVNDVVISSWLQLFDQELPVDGHLSGSADLAGSFIAPSFVVDGGIDSLTYQSVVLGDLTVSAQYSDELLTLDSVVVFSDPGMYDARGYLYANLAFDADIVERFPDRPMDIKLHFTDNRFDLVSLMLPSVEDLKGDFFADVRLSGTPTDPHIDGQAYLKKGDLKYFDLANHVKTDSAGVQMRDNQILLNDVVCYIQDKDRKSYAYIDGDITVLSLDTLDYNLEIRVPKQTPFVYELADLEGKFKAELEVRGAPPKITGDVTVFAARDRSPFPTGREGSLLMVALAGDDPWDLNINVDIESNYWIKNDDIDAEFSGDLNIIRERGRYRFAGEMEILRGKAFLFDKTFNIEPDSRVTFEDIDYPNPRLDVTMVTRIPVTKFEQEEVRTEEELPLYIGGTLENPEFSIADTDGGSDLSNEDILPLLVANYYGASDTKPGRFEERLYQYASSQVSQIATRRLGVETFEIDPMSGGEFDLATAQVTLGAYAPKVENLYLYGRATSSLVQELGFEYRLKKGFVIEGRRELDEQARERYGVNLRLHMEF